MKLRTEFRSRIEELEKSRSELKAEVLKLRDDNEENKQTQDISPREVNNVPSLFVDNPSNASPSPCEEDRKTQLHMIKDLYKRKIRGKMKNLFGKCLPE
jgi:hypothetical protein